MECVNSRLSQKIDMAADSAVQNDNQQQLLDRIDRYTIKDPEMMRSMFNNDDYIFTFLYIYIYPHCFHLTPLMAH